MRAIDIVKKWEGCKLTAYRDSAGIWTIGYGHTPATQGQTISQSTADALLAMDMAWAERAVTGATYDVPTTPNQHAAMVSLTFNIGARGFMTSHVMTNHRAKLYDAAAKAFLSWDKEHVNGQLVPNKGLHNRRVYEAEIYKAS